MLVFLAQPMIGRLVLPLFGGSPSVWNTCMVFFQTMLLLGYGYAHVSSRWLAPSTQRVVHVVLLVVLGLALPIAVPKGWTPNESLPTSLSLLLMLAQLGALPFFAVTTTAPLLQHWFGQSAHPAAREPYFLYAISNIGSMVALLGYPLVLEPLLGLRLQGTAWAIGYAGLVVLISLCAYGSHASRATIDLKPEAPAEGSPGPVVVPTIDLKQRLVWIALSFIPSSWLLSTTTRLTTDFAPIPLLWVLPLALYLLTFILVFAERQWIGLSAIARVFPFSLVVLVATLADNEGWFVGAAVNAAVFFLGTWFCHGELARRRPAAQHLTEFYLWMSLGGVLGGMFNSLLAPLIFPVLLEFPLAVTAAALSLHWHHRNAVHQVDRVHWILATLALGGLLAVFVLLPPNRDPDLMLAALGGAGVVLLLMVLLQPRVVAVAAGCVIVWTQFHVWPTSSVMHRARSFFGVHRVEQDQSIPDPRTHRELPKYRRLVHGTTQHGIQSMDPARSCEPLAYYHRTGPLGDVFPDLNSIRGLVPEADVSADPKQVGVIGLGSGAMACYAHPQRPFLFFEIDPIVIQIAQNSEYFTYLSGCGKASSQVQLGDGRLMIARMPDAHFDVIALDAFSSDAIPTHLVTREAFEVYLKKLKPRGWLVFHISNRYLDLSQVLHDLAHELQLSAVIWYDLPRSTQEQDHWMAAGKFDSTYVVVAPDNASLDRLRALKHWQDLVKPRRLAPWTDDYSNLLSIVRHQ